MKGKIIKVRKSEKHDTPNHLVGKKFRILNMTHNGCQAININNKRTVFLFNNEIIPLKRSYEI